MNRFPEARATVRLSRLEGQVPYGRETTSRILAPSVPFLRRHRPERRRRRIRKLRLLALLAVLFVLSGTAFAYGVVVAVNQQLSGLDPFRQALKQQSDGYVYAADGHTILAVLRAMPRKSTPRCW